MEVQSRPGRGERVVLRDKNVLALQRVAKPCRRRKNAGVGGSGDEG